MSEPYVAGTFKNPPTRVHSYDSRGVYMLVDENGQGCWGDPHGRVLLPTLDIVDRILKAHGYVRDEMTVRKLDGIETLPGADANVEDAPALSTLDGNEDDEPGGEDSPAGGESFEQIEKGDAPEQPEKPATHTSKRKKGR